MERKMRICRKCYNKRIHVRPCRMGEIDKCQKEYSWCKPEVIEETVKLRRIADDFSDATPVTEDGIALAVIFSP